MRAWFEAARPKTLPAAIAPVTVASALAWRHDVFDHWPALICLTFALLIQVGTNFANDYYDFLKGADTPDRIGPRRAVASGAIAPETMRRGMRLVFLAAFLVGCGLIFYGGWWLLVIGVASILCGIAYTGGPYPLGYHGLGDLFAFLFFGVVAVMFTYYVQAGVFTGDACLVSVAVGLLVANILLVNNYRDEATDRRAGKRTLVVRFGKIFAAYQYQLSCLVALLIPVLLWRKGYGPAVMLPLLLWPLAVRLRKRLSQSRSGSEFNALLAATARFLVLYAIAITVGLIVDRVVA